MIKGAIEIAPGVYQKGAFIIFGEEKTSLRTRWRNMLRDHNFDVESTVKTMISDCKAMGVTDEKIHKFLHMALTGEEQEMAATTAFHLLEKYVKNNWDKILEDVKQG